MKPGDLSMRPSYTKIEDNLYLGNFGTVINLQIIEKIGVKKVLTLREFGINEEYKVDSIDYLHISVNDTPNDDILTHFPRCHQFIEEGQRSNQTVLVHCRLGVSRSATIVISYLMSKYGKTCDQILSEVKKKRSQIKPNKSFYQQLKLWEEMDFRLNALNQKFRHFLLKRYIFVLKKKIISNILDTDMTILDKYYNLLSLNPEAEGMAYLCRKCKNVLFREINIIKDLSNVRHRYQCTNVFIEPQEWMTDQLKDTIAVGSVYCYECRTIVCNYNWNYFNCNCVLHNNIRIFQVFRIDFKSISN